MTRSYPTSTVCACTKIHVEPKEFLELTDAHSEQGLTLNSNYAEGIRLFISRFVVTSLNETL